MKNEFITYEQSLELKELGFDEECLFAYYGKSDLSNFKESDYELCGDRHNSSFKEDGRVSAPLYQQVFRWFRNKYDIDISINTIYYKYNMNTSKKYRVVIDNKTVFTNVGFYDTYEEAEFAFLNKLIMIVKQQKMLNDGRTI